MAETIESMVGLWKWTLKLNSQCLIVPVMLLNKFAYVKLVQKPFVWQKLWTLDLLVMVCHIFLLNWSKEFAATENNFLNLRDEPSAD